MNIITVKIDGIEYNLKGEEKEEYLHKVASYVDKKIKSIKENNPRLSTSSAAVLTAANVVDDMFKCWSASEQLAKESDDLRESNKRIELEAQSLKKQLHNMEAFNQELKIKIEKMESDDYIHKLKSELESLTAQIEAMEESTKQYIKENKVLNEEKKELKFQLQSYKYKIIDLENKIMNKDLDLAKEKKLREPLKSPES